MNGKTLFAEYLSSQKSIAYSITLGRTFKVLSLKVLPAKQ